MASFTRMRAAAVIITAAAIALAGCAAEEAKKPDAKTGTSLEEIAALAKKEGHGVGIHVDLTRVVVEGRDGDA